MEPGKYYLDRTGKIQGPVLRNPDHKTHCLFWTKEAQLKHEDSGWSFMFQEEGYSSPTYCDSQGRTHMYKDERPSDLIQEAVIING